MEVDDLVLFYKGREASEIEGKFVYAGRLLYKQYSRDLGLSLWPPKLGEEPWVCIFFLKDLKPVYIPISIIADAADYEKGFVVQGFMPLKQDATRKLIQQYGSVEYFLTTYASKREYSKTDAQKLIEKAPLDRIDVQVLGLSARGYNTLRRMNIDTIQQLIDCTDKDLLSLRNMGVTTLADIGNKLNSYINTMLGTGNWNSQSNRVSVNTESILSPPLEGIRIPPTLDEAFNRLFAMLKNPRQSKILRFRYGLDDGVPRTLEEVGQYFYTPITRERVRQIQKKALRKLYHPSRRHILDDIERPFVLLLQQAGGWYQDRGYQDRLRPTAD